MTLTIALGLTTAEAHELASDPQSAGRWRRIAPAFTVVGLGDPGPTRVLDPGVLAAFLSDAGSPPVFASGDTGTDLPYNLARQVLSADQLSGGRGGVLLTGRDAATDPQIYVETLVRLWHSWPRESVVADRSTGILVEVDQIRRVDHAGVAGPLSVPSSLQGSPVLLWSANSVDDVTRAPSGVDLVVLDAASGRSDISVPDGVRWLVAVGPGDVSGALQDARDAGAAGIVLRSTGGGGDDPAKTLAELLTALEGTAVVSDPAGTDAPQVPGATAREVLGLPVPTAVEPLGAVAFPGPRPLTFPAGTSDLTTIDHH
ncbi:hypothetical protein [Corynebacterium nuruki]|uniref:hypothetical protein n=1 Tax=Corynebacterium nuruki TaxID=1032851 RepID=UPI0039BFB4B6